MVYDQSCVGVWNRLVRPCRKTIEYAISTQHRFRPFRRSHPYVTGRPNHIDFVSRPNGDESGPGSLSVAIVLERSGERLWPIELMPRGLLRPGPKFPGQVVAIRRT